MKRDATLDQLEGIKSPEPALKSYVAHRAQLDDRLKGAPWRA